MTTISADRKNTALVLCFFLLIAVSLLLSLFPDIRPYIRETAIYFVSVFFESVGFVLIGSLVGGLIEIFLDHDGLPIFTGKNNAARFLLAGMSGFLLPVCECAIVPVTRRLLKKGFPPSVALTFLLAVPIFNPIVGLSTLVAFGGNWNAVFLRLGAGLVASVITGMLSSLFLKEDIVLPGFTEKDNSHHHCASCKEEEEGTFGLLMRHTWDEFVDVGTYFVLGILLAAIFRTVFNIQAIQSFANDAHADSLFMMLIAFALNLCSEADAFVGASFRGIFSGSAIFSFLLYGPMMDIKLLVMYQSVFRKKTSLFLFITVTILTVLITALLGSLGLLEAFSV